MKTMEKINRMAVQVVSNLQVFPPGDSKDSKVSLYKKGKVSAETFAQGIKRIKAAFPKLPALWYELLDEMLDVEKFTDERFKDSVYHLIKNCPYPEPTIANIISFDKHIILFTYDELIKMSNDFSPDSRRVFLNKYELADNNSKLWKLKN